MDNKNEKQGDDWLAERVGKITASKFKDVISPGRGSAPSKTRESYVIELAIERLTGQQSSTFNGNAATEWGNENEPLAIAEYEIRTGRIVNEEGFVLHPDHDYIGASPDGLVGDDGLIEVKCPHNSRNHIDCFNHGVPKAHLPQIQGQMLVCGRMWNDFVSFDPRMPVHLQLYVQRIEPDAKMMDKILSECIKVESEITEFIGTLPQAGELE